jgi:hypothetical protein
MPEVRHPDLLEALEGIQRRYRSIRMLFESYDTAGLSASAAFEGSALLIQAQAVHDFFDPTATDLFLNTMRQQDLRSRHPVFIRAMAHFVEPGQMLENDTLTTLVTGPLLARGACLVAGGVTGSLTSTGMVLTRRKIQQRFKELGACC